MESYEEGSISVPEEKKINAHASIVSYFSQQAQKVDSSQNINGIDGTGPETAKNTITGGQLKQHSESPETAHISTSELLKSSSVTNFDIPNSQIPATNDALEKVSCSTQNIDSTKAMQVIHSTDINTSIRMNMNN